jgi:probable rRNA maturation factor
MALNGVSLQVEVCIQTAAALAENLCPIASEIWEAWFHQWLVALQPNFSSTGEYELSLRLTDDRDIHTLNQQYRHQDNPTDVLAFATLDAPPPAHLSIQTLPIYLGDIVISVETAQRQAIEQGHSLATELAWLATHGLLHLLGWDHPDELALTEMLDQQRSLLVAVGVLNREQ